MAETRTVVFGPFVGEFGWEHSHWHAWVNEMCRTRYAGWRKIAVSYPGRAPFYPEVDEFVPLPEWFLDHAFVPWSYFLVDWWERRPEEASPHAAVRRLTEEVRCRFPDAEVYCPTEMGVAPGGTVFGHMTFDAASWHYCRSVPLPISRQSFRRLAASAAARARIDAAAASSERGVCLFPRHRSLRADKNWPSERYTELASALRVRFPHRPLFICGAPDGALPFEAFPDGCHDLIGVADEDRLDLHLAALARSDLAIGGLSGALLVALTAGCPALEWGEAHSQERTFDNNPLGTPLGYVEDPSPSVATVVELATTILRGEVRGSFVHPARRETAIPLTRDPVGARALYKLLLAAAGGRARWRHRMGGRSR